MSGVERAFASPEEHYVDLETATPLDIVSWVAATIPELAVATSFQSSGLVILDMIRPIRPDVPVLFLDTGFHFSETIAFKERIRALWDINIVELHGVHGGPDKQEELHGPELYRRDPDRCCHINKVEPLQRALEGFDGWISGLRRDQSPFRAETPMVEAQMLPSGREILKIHPLARWTKQDVVAYITEHDIPRHPLLEAGFASIGCWPCTRAISADEDERAGRWDGLAKSECGIHSFGRDHGPRQSEAEQ